MTSTPQSPLSKSKGSTNEKKTRFFLVFFLAALIFASAAQCGSGGKKPEQVTPDDPAPISFILDEFERAYSERDLTLMDSLLAPGFVIAYRVPDGGFNGTMTRAEYLNDLSGAFTTCGEGLSDVLDNRAIEREGDIARARVEYTYSCPSRGIEQSGVDYITLLRHSSGWKIVSIVFLKIEG